jgi:ATP-dependent RNA helicase DDX23/PRP28
MDEADRMVNLGFEEVLNYILDSLPVSNVKPDTEEAELGGDALNENMGVVGEGGRRYRVTMLYSATMPASVDRMARKYLRRPATITIGDANQAVGTVVQTVEFLNGEDKKKSRLYQILASGFEPPIIIFSTTRQSVDSLSKDILRKGYSCTTLHAGKTQDQREEALAALRSGESPILVATDLAGRGIDVPDVPLVINFSTPTMSESYIHRIGRTGRAGKKGHAITFLESTDEEWYYDLKQELARSPVSTVPRELERHPAAQQRMTREMLKRKRDDE